MERCREMDIVSRASNRCALKIFSAAILFLISNLHAEDGDIGRRASQLAEQQQWKQIVNLIEPVQTRSSDLQFYYGIALAQIGRLGEAREVLLSGARTQPGDKRFPLELGGIAFKQKLYPESVGYLRRAVKLDPNDAYANDFLATVYFLEGNLDAALKYWARAGKPKIAEVRSEPIPRVHPALLDRAFAFSPASVLKASELHTSDVRLRGLEIFPSYRFELLPRQDEAYDVVFHNKERNGFGQNKKEALFRTFRGLPFQSLHLEIFDIGQRAMNLVSLYRWDAEKRRVLAQFSAPFHGDPKYRYQIMTDLRGENWNIQSSFQGPATLLGSLNMRREALGFNFSSFASGRWQWSTGAEVSHRDFRSIIPGVALTPELLAKGYQLKQLSQLDISIWRFPEQRLTLDSTVSSQAGRLWSEPEHTFEKLQGDLRLHWFPKSQGDDYEISHQIRAGKTFGDVPFDELYMFGIQRENELWMRGHIATRDGRKGSGPIGRNYFLSNFEADKNVYHKGPFNVQAGPFLDTGKITDPIPGLGSQKWLWDIGPQLKVRAYGVGITVSYGKDLRSGNNAFYVSMLRESRH
jgi:tetratricopeptide (TPR) repeat protein